MSPHTPEHLADYPGPIPKPLDQPAEPTRGTETFAEQVALGEYQFVLERYRDVSIANRVKRAVAAQFVNIDPSRHREFWQGLIDSGEATDFLQAVIEDEHQQQFNARKRNFDQSWQRILAPMRQEADLLPPGSARRDELKLTIDLLEASQGGLFQDYEADYQERYRERFRPTIFLPSGDPVGNEGMATASLTLMEFFQRNEPTLVAGIRPDLPPGGLTEADLRSKLRAGVQFEVGQIQNDRRIRSEYLGSLQAGVKSLRDLAGNPDLDLLTRTRLNQQADALEAKAEAEVEDISTVARATGDNTLFKATPFAQETLNAALATAFSGTELEGAVVVGDPLKTFSNAAKIVRDIGTAGKEADVNVKATQRLQAKIVAAASALGGTPQAQQAVQALTGQIDDIIAESARTGEQPDAVLTRRLDALETTPALQAEAAGVAQGLRFQQNVKALIDAYNFRPDFSLDEAVNTFQDNPNIPVATVITQARDNARKTALKPVLSATVPGSAQYNILPDTVEGQLANLPEGAGEAVGALLANRNPFTNQQLQEALGVSNATGRAGFTIAQHISRANELAEGRASVTGEVYKPIFGEKGEVLDRAALGGVIGEAFAAARTGEAMLRDPMAAMFGRNPASSFGVITRTPQQQAAEKAEQNKKLRVTRSVLVR